MDTVEFSYCLPLEMQVNLQEASLKVFYHPHQKWFFKASVGVEI